MEVDSSRLLSPEDNEMLSTSMASTTGLPGDISPRNSVTMADASTATAMKKHELKILADGKVMKVQKLRQRRILSCVYCHSKKIKCSRIHPVCNNCEKLGIECKYFVNERVSRGGKKNARALVSQNDQADGNYTLSNLDTGSRSNSISSKLTNESSNRFVIKSEFSSSSDPISLSLLPPSKPSSIKDSNDLVGVNDSPRLKSSSAFKMKDHDQLMKEHVDMISKSNSPIPEMSLNYLNLNLFNQQNQQNNDSDNELNDNINDTSREKRNNKLNYSTPPNISNSLLQTPIMNNLSNNITNIYFGTNYSNQPQLGQQNSQNQQQEQTAQNSQQPHNLQQQQQQQQQQNQALNNQNDDQFAFNISSFAFTNSDVIPNINFSALNSPSILQNPGPIFNQNNKPTPNNKTDSNENIEGNKGTTTNSSTSNGVYFNRNTNNFFDSVPPQPNFGTNANYNYTHANNMKNSNMNFNPTTPGIECSSVGTVNQNLKSQPNNPGLHNSLNAYSSNPATNVNYLYGTNTEYRNHKLLEELSQHLPSSPERSFELIDRYLNSVHILLPILINVNEFLKQHEKYWELSSQKRRSSNSDIDSGISNSGSAHHRAKCQMKRNQCLMS
jgi:hypothetical protein